MANEFTLTVGGQTFTGTTASAKAQMEALHVAMRTNLILMLRSENPSEMGLVSAMGGVDYEDVQKLISLVVEGCIKRSDGVPVAENLFRDSIQDYYLLIMYALRENVGPFWQLRRPTEARAAEQPTS